MYFIFFYLPWFGTPTEPPPEPNRTNRTDSLVSSSAGSPWFGRGSVCEPSRSLEGKVAKALQLTQLSRALVRLVRLVWPPAPIFERSTQ